MKAREDDSHVRIFADSGGRYTIRDQELIIRHLAACSISAEKSLASELAMAGKDADKMPYAGRIAYWRHVLAAAKLFAFKCTTRQTKALALSPEEIERVRSEWNQQTMT